VLETDQQAKVEYHLRGKAASQGANGPEDRLVPEAARGKHEGSGLSDLLTGDSDDGLDAA
jgi:hypothetical protein